MALLYLWTAPRTSVLSCYDVEFSGHQFWQEVYFYAFLVFPLDVVEYSRELFQHGSRVESLSSQSGRIEPNGEPFRPNPVPG